MQLDERVRIIGPRAEECTRDCRDRTWQRRQRGSLEYEKLMQVRNEEPQVRRVVVVEKRVELREVGQRITDTVMEASKASESQAGSLHQAIPRPPESHLKHQRYLHPFPG